MIDLLHESNLAQVWCGPVEEWIGLSDEWADLLVTDPPYGVSWRSGFRKNFSEMEGDDGTYDPIPVIGGVVERRLKRFGHVYVFGRDLTPHADDLRLGGVTELVWDKKIIGPGNLSSPWGPQHEKVWFGVHVPSRSNRGRGDGRLSARLRQGSVIRVPRRNSRQVSRHPTEKPVQLLRILIESSSHLGDVVLDPYAGSGSTGVAAIIEGRRTILVEIDRKYAELAVERMKEAEEWVSRVEKL